MKLVYKFQASIASGKDCNLIFWKLGSCFFVNVEEVTSIPKSGAPKYFFLVGIDVVTPALMFY